ncbi:MAG: hypothetical protein ACYTGP_08050, partial [Planctomycetota bacterium]
AQLRADLGASIKALNEQLVPLTGDSAALWETYERFKRELVERSDEERERLVETVGRLQQRLDEVAQQHTTGASEESITDISERLGTVQRQLDERIEAVDASLGMLARTIEAAGDSAGAAAAGGIDASARMRLAELDTRIADVTAELTRLSEETTTTTPADDPLPALEERLAELDRALTERVEASSREAIEQLQSALAHHAEDGADAGEPHAGHEELAQKIADVDTRLGTTIDRVESRIAEALERFESGRGDVEGSLDRIDNRCRDLDVEVRASLESFERRLTSAAASPAPAASAPVAPGAVEMPDTPQGAHAHAFVHAVNSGVPDRIRDFIREHYTPSAVESVPMDQRLTVYRRLLEMTEGIEIRFARSAGAEGLRMLTQARGDGSWHAYQFQFAPEAPHGIISVAIDPITEGEAAAILAGE